MVDRDERMEGTRTAWRLLTSPGVFLGVTAILTLVLAWAHTVPQRAAAGELAAHAPFAEAEALSGLGLDDVWASWVTLLLVLLLGLVGAGMLLVRSAKAPGTRPSGPFTRTFEALANEPLDVVRGRVVAALGGRRVAVKSAGAAIVARRGVEPEAVGALLLGLGALLASLFIGRANGFEARLTLIPGQTDDPAAVAVRDGEIFLPRALPLDLRCQRPDPQDPLRRELCRLRTGADGRTEEIMVAPGQPVSTSVGTLALLRERPQLLDPTRPLELVVRRGDRTERLVVEAGKTTQLAATGERLTVFVGPDGPLAVSARPGQAPVLLAPPTSAAPAGSTFLEAVVPSEQVLTLTRSPESILTILGLLLVALALVALALVPSVRVRLDPQGMSTHVSVSTANASGHARDALQQLLGSRS